MSGNHEPELPFGPGTAPPAPRPDPDIRVLPRTEAGLRLVWAEIHAEGRAQRLHYGADRGVPADFDGLVTDWRQHPAVDMELEEIIGAAVGPMPCPGPEHPRRRRGEKPVYCVEVARLRALVESLGYCPGCEEPQAGCRCTLDWSTLTGRGRDAAGIGGAGGGGEVSAGAGGSA